MTKLTRNAARLINIANNLDRATDKGIAVLNAASFDDLNLAFSVASARSWNRAAINLGVWLDRRAR